MKENHIQKPGNANSMIKQIMNSMKPNNPIYSDLSTYQPQLSIPFYEQIFGWKFYKESDYYTAFYDNQAVAGLYETPDKFKQMRMPHFWMTYFEVNRLDKTLEKACELGGIIEMKKEINGYGKVALIRDPMGAGFTIYEGNSLKSTRTKNKANTLVWNELHVSDKSMVLPFYQGIFNWIIRDTYRGAFEVYTNKEEHIADIMEFPVEVKGKYEYWISCFGVQSLHDTKHKIIESGGTLINDEGYRILCTDNSKEAFFYITNTES